jgi:periplasmic protein CpxP/Spy
MNKKQWITMAAVLALSTSMAVAAPHGRGGKGGKMHGRGGAFGERMAEKLNLSDAQKQQIRDLQRNFRETNKAFFDQMRDTHKQMAEARKAGDTARVDALKATLQTQRPQMQQLHEQQQQRIAAILTPEQRTQWETMKAEREARRGERSERRRNKQ